MSVGLAIVIVFLLLFAFSLRLGGAFLIGLSVFVGVVLVVTMLVRLAQRAAGGDRSDAGAKVSGASARAVRTKQGLVCPDPDCGRVNEPRARFCGQCGKPLG